MAENLSLELDIEGAADGGGGTARIFVRTASSYLKEGGEPVVSDDCASIEGLDGEVGRLKRELDSIRERARRHFDAQEATEAEPEAAPARVASTDKAPLQIRADLRVADRMSVSVETIRRNQKVSEAATRFAAREIRHLVVLDDDADEIVGVLGERHIVFTALDWAMGQGKTVYENLMESVRVKDCMQPHASVVTPDTPLSEAAAQMAQHKLDCLPVVEEGDLVGILTEWDFLAMLGDASYGEETRG